MAERRRTLVSACLVGVRCRYDGRDKRYDLATDGELVPVCPEVMAGFGVPRPAIERSADGTVREVESRKDVTAALEDACARIVTMAHDLDIKDAVLKQNSPSCGSTHTWRDGALLPGFGLLTERLRAAGVTVGSE